MAVVIAFLFALQAVLSNGTGSERDVKAFLAATRPVAWHFVALEYHSGFLNRTYVVFVTANMICGARVRGLLAAPMQVTERWHDPLFYPRPSLVARYEGVDLGSPEFMAMSRENFRLGKGEVTSIEFTSEPKWGMGAVPYSGRLLLALGDDRKKELILLGKQDGPLLRERLIAAGFGTAAA